MRLANDQNLEPAIANSTPGCAVRAFTATTAAGTGNAALWQALRERASGLRRNDLEHCSLDTYIGRVAGLEAIRLPTRWASWECRNNRLAWLGLNQDGFLAEAAELLAQYGPERVALVLGTSTASMASTEAAYRVRGDTPFFPPEYGNPKVHSPHSLVGFVAEALGIRGPQLTVATACSSSARVFGSALRLIKAGFADAAIVGGVDSLCLSVMYGFNALELMSPEPCRPFDVRRKGLNIGEAAGFAILDPGGAGVLRISGHGESSDAHHMSSPHPQGLGAQQAMQVALKRARVEPRQIDYVNLHGTATRINDDVEIRALAAVYASPPPCSSTKGYTGHTLGAAGIVDAVIALLSLEYQWIPGNLGCEIPEPHAAAWVERDNSACPLRHVMSNSFGFGGNNCALVFSRGT